MKAVSKSTLHYMETISNNAFKNKYKRNVSEQQNGEPAEDVSPRKLTDAESEENAISQPRKAIYSERKKSGDSLSSPSDPVSRSDSESSSRNRVFPQSDDSGSFSSDVTATSEVSASPLKDSISSSRSSSRKSENEQLPIIDNETSLKDEIFNSSHESIDSIADRQVGKLGKMHRTDSFRSVKNRKSLKKKRGFMLSMSKKNERRDVIQKNLTTLSEISTVIHVSTELPLPLETERMYMKSIEVQEHENIMDVSDQVKMKNDDQAFETQGVEEHVVTSVSFQSEKDQVTNSEDLSKVKIQKVKTTKKQRELLAKKQEKKPKQEKKESIKASRSLIDLFLPFEGKNKKLSKDELPFKIKAGLPSMDVSKIPQEEISAAETIPKEDKELSKRPISLHFAPITMKKSISTGSLDSPFSQYAESVVENKENLESQDNEQLISSHDNLDIEPDVTETRKISTASASPRQIDSDAPTHISSSKKKFQRRFSKTLPNEKALKSYVCAIVSDILLQGTLYITENYFAFYSNILGFINKTEIPIVNVETIQKEKTARFIPNAVGIQTYDGKTYVFSSLVNRDVTYRYMVHIWKSRQQFDEDHHTDEVKRSYSSSSCSEVDEVTYESSDSSQMINKITEKPPSVTITKSQEMINKSSSTISKNQGRTKRNSSSDRNHNASPPGPQKVLPKISSKDKNLARESTSDNEANTKITKPSLKSDASNKSSQQSKLHKKFRTNIVKSVFIAGLSPFQAVREGLHELTSLPRSSIILIASSLLMFLLLISGIFMVYKVENLSQQINHDANADYSRSLYEDVLQMQRQLHSVTAEEVEKTLNIQITHLATVRRSLDALVFLFSKDSSEAFSQLPEK